MKKLLILDILWKYTFFIAAERIDEKLHKRTTVRMGIRVVQRAFAPPSPYRYVPGGGKTTKEQAKMNRKALLFGCKSAPLDNRFLDNPGMGSDCFLNLLGPTIFLSLRPHLYILLHSWRVHFFIGISRSAETVGIIHHHSPAICADIRSAHRSMPECRRRDLDPLETANSEGT